MAMKYVRKIDALRAIAVLMVVMSHWIPKTAKRIPFGEIGVDIFFVISGFLITGILLHEREKARSQDESKSSVLRNFVVRRALRIFPIYYLSLLVFWLMQSYESYHIRENLSYYLTYTANILFFQERAWDSYLAPLWSLAVEEQFYLIWPLLMIWIPAKQLRGFILFSIAIGIVFPYFFNNPMVKVLTPACFNALGIGAFLAFLNLKNRDWLERNANFILGVAIFAVILLGATVLWFPLLGSLVRTLISLITVATIMYCTGVYKPVAAIEWVFNHRVLIFIGQISYGIYLYHNIVSVFWRNLVVPHLDFVRLAVGTAGANGIFLIAKFIILIILAWLSYQLIEKPFLSLKRFFVLRQPTVA
jgi:peptidoglycan/LPS O-acetylase OafA/YrhL